MVTEKDVIYKSVLKSVLEEKEGNLKLLKLNQSLQQTAHPGTLTSSLQGPLMSLAPRLMTLRGTKVSR